MSYGKEGLPAGPAVAASEVLIVVEGRADIINLLRAGIENTIAVEGTSVPDTVKELARKGKTLYAFLDGDRGGDLILKELSQVARIDKVFRAPRGREVEELTPIELLEILRGAPQDERAEVHEERDERRDRPQRFERGGYERRGRYDRRDRGDRRPPRERSDYQYEDKPPERAPAPQLPPPPPLAPEVSEKVKVEYAAINGTLEAKVFDAQWAEMARMPVNELVSKMDGVSGAKYLIFDGIVTQRLIDSAAKVGVESLIGHRAGEIQNKPENLAIYSFKDLGLE